MALKRAIVRGVVCAFAGYLGAGLPASAEEFGAPAAHQVWSAARLPESASDLLALSPRTWLPEIQIGSFVISPILATSVNVDNNVFASSHNKRSDVSLSVDAGIRAVSNWSRHALELYASGGGIFYNEHSSETRGLANFGASGVLEIQRDLWIRSYSRYAFLPEERGTGESFPLYEKPIERQLFGGGLLVHKGFNRLWVEAGVQATHEDYSDATLRLGGVSINVDQDFRDGTVWEVFGRYGYDLSPKTSVFLENSQNWRRFNDASFDSQGYKALAGVRYTFTRLVRGEAAFGYMHQDAEPGRSDIDSYTYRAQLMWEPTPFVTLAFLGSRDVGSPSRYVTGSNRVVSEVGIRADYAIRRHLIFTAAVAYDWTDYVDLGRNDERWRLHGGVTYALGPSVSLFANYTYWIYGAGAVPDVNYAKSLPMVGVRAQF